MIVIAISDNAVLRQQFERGLVANVAQIRICTVGAARLRKSVGRRGDASPMDAAVDLEESGTLHGQLGVAVPATGRDELTARAGSWARGARAAATWAADERQWARFETWCAHVGELALPADPLTVARRAGGQSVGSRTPEGICTAGPP